MDNRNNIEKDIIDELSGLGDKYPISINEMRNIIGRLHRTELTDCLTWLQNRMDEYSDKEVYQDDYKIVSTIWNFMRSRIKE